jgi:hypothetical protein
MLKDRFDREVFVGCTVAYPGRKGASCWISTGRVVQIDEDEGRLKLEGGSHRKGSRELGIRWIGFDPRTTLVLS